ncbi:MBL fold metallo-hydrolase [Alteromonas oceanisediminis]|uniref:MBL fold metallo-hydrolase n=1 Tax=Alteromonas oceanisediminis TaxID=2836180 RepID=UPI001BD96D33|nr:MBL fold metallo-hydrolase [Alteromonas oceanisediminis]MBT0585254.1 MBL fold metallo-hydrolase [Alteromonas oceanisediminis]
MKITQIRNATIIVESQDICMIVDPMMAKKSALPKLRYFKSQLKNPLVDLPAEFSEFESRINCALITHCQKGHFDHLDRAGVRWLKEKQLVTFCTPRDASYLAKKGIHTHELEKKRSVFFDGTIVQVPATHTSGWLTPFMEHGTGYFIQLPKAQSVYLMGDTILTDEIRKFVVEQQPDFIVAPLLLNEEEILELASLFNGKVICNHMEALDHCRINRHDLRDLVASHALSHRYIIPRDGETIDLLPSE